MGSFITHETLLDKIFGSPCSCDTSRQISMHLGRIWLMERIFKKNYYIDLYESIIPWLGITLNVHVPKLHVKYQYQNFVFSPLMGLLKVQAFSFQQTRIPICLRIIPTKYVRNCNCRMTERRQMPCYGISSYNLCSGELKIKHQNKLH